MALDLGDEEARLSGRVSRAGQGHALEDDALSDRLLIGRGHGAGAGPRDAIGCTRRLRTGNICVGVNSAAVLPVASKLRDVRQMRARDLDADLVRSVRGDQDAGDQQIPDDRDVERCAGSA
jgi:hypothetical protein